MGGAPQHKPITDEVLARMPESLRDEILDRRARGVPVGGLHRPEASIFDVDGTLCNVESIRHMVVLAHPENPGYRDFDHFHKASLWCPPHPEVVAEAAKHAAAGRFIIVVTARRERYRTYTRAWLDNNRVPWAELHMRRDDDGRPDAVIKREILETLRIRYDVTHAFDDNPGVLEVWRGEQIPNVIEIPGWMEDT